MDALNTVMRLGQGEFIEDLARHIDAVSEAVMTAGRKARGRVTVVFDIEYPEKGFDRAAVVLEHFADAYPKAAAKGAMFYVVDGLHVSDPRAPELPSFRRVESDQGDPRGVAADQAAREVNHG